MSLYRTVEDTFKSPYLQVKDLSLKLRIWQQYYLEIVRNYHKNILAPSNILLVIVEFCFVTLLTICGVLYYILQSEKECDMSIYVECISFILISCSMNLLCDRVMRSILGSIVTYVLVLFQYKTLLQRALNNT
ncbi:unnamed protein product [Acanthoscelides obtectus]|uniref:Uncharacterized protein n=1 Tax=Acanthoscelides obtectus TaxID=200917 RepID=A0A9P0KPB1_ACAOB|nr:unnamed protein product [Acanthoscelides obtectus]CAK1666727.1 hypothetical protein AOBTE_LOCUS25458 [Acanthoscelides obtectus]